MNRFARPAAARPQATGDAECAELWGRPAAPGSTPRAGAKTRKMSLMTPFSVSALEPHASPASSGFAARSPFQLLAERSSMFASAGRQRPELQRASVARMEACDESRASRFGGDACAAQHPTAAQLQHVASTAAQLAAHASAQTAVSSSPSGERGYSFSLRAFPIGTGSSPGCERAVPPPNGDHLNTNSQGCVCLTSGLAARPFIVALSHAAPPVPVCDAPAGWTSTRTQCWVPAP